MSELPRLLAGVRAGAAVSYEEHRSIHPEPDPAALVAALEETALRGRGGAAFPAWRKLQAVASARGPRVVLVNAAEADPLSRKDRVLCALAPHLVIDGALAAAGAIGARDVTIAASESATRGLAALREAIAERPDARRVTVRAVPPRYLAGQEIALIRHLDGGPLRPVLTPPRPAERGLRRRPTLVNNAETVAHMALIAGRGADWFAGVGAEREPGSALVTLTGAIAEPGVREIAIGTRLTTLISRAGGTNDQPRAVLVGGCHGTWLAADEIADVTLDAAGLGRHGAALGSGAITVLGGSACPVRELAAIVAWLAGEGAGQCGPCANGLPAIATLLEQVADGRATRDAPELLARWGAQISGRGACHLPDGVAGIVRSGARVFAAELKRHAHRGPCIACDRPTLLQARPLVAA